ncbi:MAG: ABC transporter ATP-binding protein, partial [Planctomycetota bacterium]
MSEEVIQIKGLVKYFDGRCVLGGIDLDVERGCIYGLLGRNGAGKTTIIRILMGLENASRGETYLLGSPSTYLPNKIKSRVGYVAEAHNLIQNYRVNRLIKLCKDLSLNWNEVFFRDLIKRFRLPLERKVKELSMGMRAQLNLSLAMAIEPEVLILDDPTLGLDTVSRREFLELAVDVIQREGRTILFCSHILSDVERIADRIGILCAGKLVVDCGLEELKERVTKLQIIFKEKAPSELYMKDII